MIAEHKKHVSNDNDKKNGVKKEPPYDISPDHNGDYNRVTYADKILKAGREKYLDGIQTPYGVKKKMNGKDPNGLGIEGMFDAKDALDNAVKKGIDALGKGLSVR